MDKSRPFETDTDETGELGAKIEQAISEIQQIRQQMQRDQADIESSREKTWAMLAKLAVC